MASAVAEKTKEPIDAVYLWVDGSDSKFQEELRRSLTSEPRIANKIAASPQRFRDNGELRYSLRSLELYAPWIRRVFIVTNGQVPEWLNSPHERLSLVFHEQIVPDTAALPIFNSCAIELSLHRIPGISRHFLYMNDDFFFGRKLAESNFITPAGGQRLYFEPNPITRQFAKGPVHDRAYAHTNAILDRLWGKRRRNRHANGYWRAWKEKMFLRPGRRLLPAHVPQLYDKDVLQELERLLAEEFAATRSHRFRSENDLVLRLIYFFSLLESGRFGNEMESVLLNWVSDDFHFIMLTNCLATAQANFSKSMTLRPKFLCVNDDMGDVAPDHPVFALFRNFLQTRFPAACTFEQPLSPPPSRRDQDNPARKRPWPCKC